MLEFILGRACTGKTYQVINRVSAASKCGRAVLIVPEQFSFESERAVIKHEDAVIDNINVLSFSRLYEDVIQKSGKGGIACVSEFEKLILIRKALKASVDSLEIFSKYSDQLKFCHSISDTINEIKLSGVENDELLNVSEIIGGSCGAKLKDIVKVMSTYEAMLTDKFIDPADKLTRLYQVLNDFNYFKDTTVFFDSFNGFTGSQYKIIDKIIEQADNVVFSFCTDKPDDESLGVFHNINSTIRRIKSIAKAHGIKDISVNIFDKHFYSNDSMLELESLMSSERLDNSFSSNGNIRVISCNNKREEALAAANIIAKEVREQGYRFKDFIIVSRNADEYSNFIMRQCNNNNIACFMDKSVRLSETPLGIYLLSLCEVARSASTDNIIKILKLGLLDFSLEEISELEDYVFIWDIKAADWKNTWTMSVNGLQIDDDRKRDVERLEAINATRAKIEKIITDFKNEFCGSPTKRAKALYSHLTDNHIDSALSKLCDEFESEGDNYYSSVLKQSWDAVIEILDSLVRVLDECDISYDEFIDALIIAMEAYEISNTPQMLDEVTFGSADRIRPSKPKISIILGANQGVFPKNTAKTGLLIQSDKEKLLRHGIIIDNDAIASAVEENFLVYSMLCCPVDKVYVLYSKKAMNGEEMEPSSFISQILNGFSDLSVTDFLLTASDEFVPHTPKSAFLEIGSLTENDFSDIKYALSKNPEYSQKLSQMENSGKDLDFSISADTSRSIFGNELHISATKFDNYHKCSLSYFLKSGLRIKKLQKADLNVLQRGTIAHYVLETIVQRYHGELANFTKPQLSVEVDKIIHEYMSLLSGSEILMTARFAYLLDKISSSVKQIVYHIAEEFAQSKFEPRFCELEVGNDGDIPRMEYTLSDGSKAYFDGKIDRVDVYENNVRVVDYKTGKMTFTLSDTLVGLNMQMLLYLYAFIKNGGDLVDSPKPAGILYMPAKSSKDKKHLRMNGLISNDEDIRTAMEKDNEGLYISKYSEKSSEYINQEHFGLVFNKIDELMCKMGDTVRSGDFKANPTDGLNIKACAYCDFAPICRSSNNEHKKAVKYSNDEIFEMLEGGVKNELSAD